MKLTLNLNEAEFALASKYATQGQVSVENIILKSAMKSLRNAEYLSMLDRSIKQFEEGKFVVKTTEELEKLIHG